MIKAVPDTNIIVSGIISPRGTPAGIIRAWRDKKFQLVMTGEILKEISEVMSRPKIARYNITPEKRKALLLLLYKYSIMTPGKLKTDISEDPDDNIFLSCAVEGGADHIVSGDEHLLKLKAYENIDIITAEAFLRILER